jgi:hypothetical protein
MRLHTARAGTADLHEAVHVALGGADRVHAVLDPQGPLPGLPIDLKAPEPLLLELARDDGPRVQFAVGATEITPALHDLLEFAGGPRSMAELRAHAERLGAGAEETPGLLRRLIEEGTLVPAP